MAFLYLDKIPLFILGIGLLTSFALPGSAPLDSSKFLHIYSSTILAGVSFIYQVFRHGTNTEIFLAMLIIFFFYYYAPRYQNAFCLLKCSLCYNKKMTIYIGHNKFICDLLWPVINTEQPDSTFIIMQTVYLSELSSQFNKR